MYSLFGKVGYKSLSVRITEEIGIHVGPGVIALLTKNSKADAESTMNVSAS